ncbi:MAG: putative aminohydrolase SsnA [Terracidiphilus sp.]|jgi:putative selenium metabolism protein SsnA
MVKNGETCAQLLVGNGRLITHDERMSFLDNGCVAIGGGLILAVGSTVELQATHPGAKFIDARGRVIMPGLINTHTHLYGTFARGMALKDDAPSNFTEILERLWWRLDRALTLDDVYWSAMVGMMASIRNGVTTIFDHHASPGAVSGSLFRIADAARQTGVRSCLCYEVSDRDGAEITRQGIEENRAFLGHCADAGDDRLRGLFGMHASFTLSDETLARCSEAAADFDAGFHVHTAEAAVDALSCRREHGMSIVERWNKFDILKGTSLLAHCVHVDQQEIELLRARGAKVIHNPQSNMSNAVGCAPVLEMMRLGVHVGLGTDGYTADMFESMKAAGLLQKHDAGDPRVAWAEPPQMLFRENAATASECFGSPVGKLIPGAHADIILINYDPPTPMNAENLNEHIHFGFSGDAVETVLISGQIVMDDRQFPAIDEREVIAKSRAAAAEMWKRF